MRVNNIAQSSAMKVILNDSFKKKEKIFDFKKLEKNEVIEMFNKMISFMEENQKGQESNQATQTRGEKRSIDSIESPARNMKQRNLKVKQLWMIQREKIQTTKRWKLTEFRFEKFMKFKYYDVSNGILNKHTAILLYYTDISSVDIL